MSRVALPWPMGTFAEHPAVGGAFGILVAVACVLGLFWSVAELRRFPDKPTVLDTAAAAAAVTGGKRILVIIDDAKVRCGAAGTDDKTVLAESPAGRPILVAFDDVVRCDFIANKTLRGVLSVTSGRALEYRLKKGLDLSLRPAGEELLSLCTFCGPGNARMGLVVCSIGLVLGLAMYPMSRVLRRHFLGPS